MRRPKLSPEQEGEVYRRAKAGTPYASIQAWLASQGIKLAKSSISEIIPRVERRALAQRPTPLPDVYTDPHTGVVVEVTDEMILGYIRRDLMTEFLSHKNSRRCRLSAVRIALRVMNAQRTIAAPFREQRR